MPADDTARSELQRELESSSEEPDLVDLADRRRELVVLRRAAVQQAQISGIQSERIGVSLPDGPRGSRHVA
jgi:hypothetical protein